jgi:hypothetical protein
VVLSTSFVIFTRTVTQGTCSLLLALYVHYQCCLMLVFCVQYYQPGTRMNAYDPVLLFVRREMSDLVIRSISAVTMNVSRYLLAMMARQ